MWTGCLLATTATTKTTAAVAATLARVTTWTLAATATTSVATTGTWAGCLAVAHALQHLGPRGFGRSLHHVAARRFTGTTPDSLATHGDGLSPLTWLRTKTFDDFDFDVLLGKALDVLHEAFFVQTHQVDGGAIGTGAAGTANAVHIVFADVGDFVVHDMGQVVNIDPAGSDVGSDQSAYIAALEARQGLGAG